MIGEIPHVPEWGGRSHYKYVAQAVDPNVLKNGEVTEAYREKWLRLRYEIFTPNFRLIRICRVP